MIEMGLPNTLHVRLERILIRLLNLVLGFSIGALYHLNRVPSGAVYMFLTSDLIYDYVIIARVAHSHI
jgi:hypothetical protein